MLAMLIRINQKTKILLQLSIGYLLVVTILYATIAVTCKIDLLFSIFFWMLYIGIGFYIVRDFKRTWF